LILYFHSRSGPALPPPPEEIAPFLKITELDFTNPLHRALFRETVEEFYPENPSMGDTLLTKIDHYRQQRVAFLTRQNGKKEGLSGWKLLQIIKMFIIFVFAYVLVLVLTYYGVQTLAVWRFVRRKQRKPSFLLEGIDYLRMHRFPRNWKKRWEYLKSAGIPFGLALLKAMAYLVLFSPAYVIAYSFKTRIDTDTFLFLVILGVISNGLLITYAQKFYTFLVKESQKGYVETARVKNLSNLYSHSPRGIPLRRIFAWNKTFPGHVFHHIFINARYQYLTTFKEQASFVISGLVIIEMALNIHGHLCYELLQNLLYKQFDVALTIILSIFILVKATEIFTDYWHY
ncbi:MAG: hypothetical protein D6732_01545, partial [Methanobacteriota archaeon]